MTNQEYTAAVARGEFPRDPLVPTDDVATTAGVIKNLLLSGCQSVAVIESIAGAMRSNHYHKTDWHYMYVVSGEMQYLWRPVDTNVAPHGLKVQPGEMVFTPPMVEHLTFFPTATIIVTAARNSRDHAGHEADLVRVDLETVVKHVGVNEWR